MKRLKFLLIVALMGFTNCKKPVETSEKTQADRKGLTAIVLKDGINLRKSPNVSAPVVLVLPKGAILSLLAKSSEPIQIYKCPHYWFQASYGQQTGWVYGEFLTDFIDTNRRSYTTEEKGLKIEMSIPQSWNGDSSVLSDAAGAKIMETSPPDEVHGDFETAIRAKYKAFENSEHPYQIYSITKIPHPKFTVFRVITETGFEGGCPNWAGQWYPVGYYFQTSGTQYLDISFYLRDIKDKEKIVLFDEIAKMVNIK